MVLEKADEGGGGEVSARLTARAAAVARVLALVGEALGEGATERRRRRLVIGIVAASLAREQRVQGVVHVVVPLRTEERRAVAGEEVGLVAVVLEHEVDLPLGAGALGHHLRQLDEHVRAGLVAHRLDRVQAKAVHVELLEPVKGVVDHEGPNDLGARAVEVDRRAPRRLAGRVEEGGRVTGQVVALGPEVVVDHVEEHGQAAGVGGVDEALEVFGTPIPGRGGER